jgi:hypothetical protein
MMMMTEKIQVFWNVIFCLAFRDKCTSNFEALGTTCPMTELHLQENLNYQILSLYLNLFAEGEGQTATCELVPLLRAALCPR